MGCSDFTVVIPVKDEEEGLPVVLEELLGAGVGADRIIVVDGDSSDGTVNVARRYGVTVVRQRYPGGKAGGVRSGLEASKSRYVIVMDGDATYPGYMVWDFCRKLEEGYDMVIGVRRPEPGAMNPVFALGNKLLTFWFNLNFGTRLRDVLSGMYALRVEALSGAEWMARGFSVESEIVAHIASTSENIAEVDIEYRRRVGKKKLNVFDGLKIFIDMIRLSWAYNPVFAIFLTASLILIPGLALDMYYLYHYIVSDVKFYMKGLVGVIMTVVGAQSLALALLALFLKRMEIRLRRAINMLAKAR